MSTLCHHGIKGQKWGVRRFRNPDGTLTEAGKRRISKEYSKVSQEVNREFSKKQSQMWVDAHNKTSDKFNKGESERFNTQWEREHGKNSFDDEYVQAYMDHFDKEFAKNYNTSLAEFYKNSSAYHKAEAMSREYGMTEWDNLARENAKTVAEVRRAAEKALGGKKTATGHSTEQQKAQMFKKHPDLYDDFGGPDKIDDNELYELTLQEKGYKPRNTSTMDPEMERYIHERGSIDYA